MVDPTLELGFCCYYPAWSKLYIQFVCGPTALIRTPNKNKILKLFKILTFVVENLHSFDKKD